MAKQERIQQDIETLRRITEPCACGTQRPSYTPESVSYTHLNSKAIVMRTCGRNKIPYTASVH